MNVRVLEEFSQRGGVDASDEYNVEIILAGGDVDDLLTSSSETSCRSLQKKLFLGTSLEGRYALHIGNYYKYEYLY